MLNCENFFRITTLKNFLCSAAVMISWPYCINLNSSCCIILICLYILVFVAESMYYCTRNQPSDGKILATPICLLSTWGTYWFVDVWELFKVYSCCVFYGCNSVWLSFCQWCWKEQFKWLKTCIFIYKLWKTVFLWQSHLSQSLFILHFFLSDLITLLIRT